MKYVIDTSVDIKTYVQEQPLRWGYLTPEREESGHHRVKLEGRKRR